ncbi:hypothetical protein MPSEU_000190400 [Mayamaea pseudoterrestris]|nr:hypothetical protein MPSEU_000190400 [Mayamaea pseudoterrestris]
MVVRHGVEVQLVYADSKLPVKEFEKNGKIYVEAEPDADYFIAIRRIGWEGDFCIISKCVVDGTRLRRVQSHLFYDGAIIYAGIPSRINGEVKTTALQFTRPRFTKGSRNTELGKVEVLLYQAILTNNSGSNCSDYSTSFQTSLDHASDAVTDALKKKFVRSKQGSTVITSRQSNNNSGFTISFGRGAFINKVTLNYCTALGLVHVGVLPKPPVWMLHRMKHPAPPGDCTAQFKKMKHPEKDKEIEYIDLTDEDVSEAFT